MDTENMGKLQYKMLEEPGITSAIVATIIALVIKAFASYGLTLTPEVNELITYTLVLVVPFVVVLVSRYFTTPLVRPVDALGNALTP